jgi:hypothetical protein
VLWFVCREQVLPQQSSLTGRAVVGAYAGHPVLKWPLLSASPAALLARRRPPRWEGAGALRVCRAAELSRDAARSLHTPSQPASRPLTYMAAQRCGLQARCPVRGRATGREGCAGACAILQGRRRLRSARALGLHLLKDVSLEESAQAAIVGACNEGGCFRMVLSVAADRTAMARAHGAQHLYDPKRELHGVQGGGHVS